MSDVTFPAVSRPLTESDSATIAMYVREAPESVYLALKNHLEANGMKLHATGKWDDEPAEHQRRPKEEAPVVEDDDEGAGRVGSGKAAKRK